MPPPAAVGLRAFLRAEPTRESGVTAAMAKVSQLWCPAGQQRPAPLSWSSLVGELGVEQRVSPHCRLATHQLQNPASTTGREL